MRASPQQGLVLLPLLVWCAGCADDTFAVVSVRTRSGSLDDVAQLRVHVTNASAEDILVYPPQGSRALHLEAQQPVTFSVEFPDWSGQATFEVEPLARDGGALAYGKTNATINRHAVAAVAVNVVPGAFRPDHPQGGVTSDSPLSCAPAAPADACGANRTCELLCTSTDPAASMCYGSGAGQPGDSCAGNGSCAPGSQCFTFTATGCNVKTCLRFCTGDSTCADASAFCNVPIPCGNGPRFSACSRPCDPTVTINNGCATGLSCFVYPGETTDCACPGFGSAGAGCTQNSGCNGEPGCSGCAAGFSCVIPTGTDAGASNGVCRPACKLAAPTCPSGTACHPFDNASRKVFGFCQ
jgi:hypothetical protein